MTNFGLSCLIIPFLLATVFAAPTNFGELVKDACGLSLCGGVKRATDGKIANPTISNVTCPNDTVSYAGVTLFLNPLTAVSCANATRVCATSILDPLNNMGIGYTSTDFSTPKLVTVSFNGTSSAGSTDLSLCSGSNPPTTTSSSGMVELSIMAIAWIGVLAALIL